MTTAKRTNAADIAAMQRLGYRYAAAAVELSDGTFSFSGLRRDAVQAMDAMIVERSEGDRRYCIILSKRARFEMNKDGAGAKWAALCDRAQELRHGVRDRVVTHTDHTNSRHFG